MKADGKGGERERKKETERAESSYTATNNGFLSFPIMRLLRVIVTTVF